MLEQGVLLWPFINVPEDGALPKLTIYDVPYKIK